MLPKDSLLAHKHFRRLRTLIEEKSEGPAELVLTILRILFARFYPALARADEAPNTNLISQPEVSDFVEWLGGMEALTAAFWLSSSYAALVGKRVRDHSAMFFTPPSLSIRMVDDLVLNGASLTKHIWLDPACGGAAFLAPVAQRMAEALRANGASSLEILNHVSRHLIGNDIDPCLALMSKGFIRMILYSEIEDAGIEPELNVMSENALSNLIGLQGHIDVVICNPPYRKMNASEVDLYRADYGDVINGQPNIYSLFFKLSLTLLDGSGVAGLLTPTSYFSGRYFSALREYILQHAEVRHIDIVPAMGAFFSVDQETAIAVMKCLPSLNREEKHTNVYRLERSSGFQKVGLCHLQMNSDAWLVPRNESDVSLLSKFGNSPFRLKDYGYKARVGNFVWNRDKRETLREYCERDSGAVFPLIWSSDIQSNGGFEHGRGKRSSHGKFVDMGDRAAPGVIRRPCVILQRVTSSDQSKRLIGSVIPLILFDKYKGVVGENHVVFLQQVDSEPRISPEQLVTVLGSWIIDRLFRCISGAVNVSVYELNHLPMPNPGLLCEMLSCYTSPDEAVAAAYCNDDV